MRVDAAGILTSPGIKVALLPYRATGESGKAGLLQAVGTICRLGKESHNEKAGNKNHGKYNESFHT